jgi:hypothetical protein
MDATTCDTCGSRFWSPIRLDEESMKERLHDIEEPALEQEVLEEEEPVRRRAYR